MRVTFLNPASDADPFYRKMVQFARIAAEDLGVEFEVLEARRDLDRLRSLALGLTGRTDPPDYLILVNDRNVVAELLPGLSEAGLRIFVTCEGFFLAERQILGLPRENYPNWLGSLLPDDEQAGELLAETLIAAAREHGRAADDGSIHVIGLSGSYSIGAILRLNGLRKAVARHPDVVLDEVAPALWDHDTAASLTPELVSRNPEASVVWGANDDMALGAATALAASGRRPGVDIVLGGIDWAPAALCKIEEGVFAGSVGGHFLDCAWSLVMLHDHHHGHDFGATVAHSEYVALTRENSERYTLFFDEAEWARIRFSAFSKQRHPAVGEYRFGLDAILDSL